MSSSSAPIDPSSSSARAPAPAPGPERFVNRELSWLEFNRRVLALAEDPALPVLERAKFVAIFSQNLDEFFQVRVAGLEEQRGAGVGAVSIDGRTPGEQLAAIRESVVVQIARQSELYQKDLVPRLAEHRIRICDWKSLPEAAQRELGEVFERQIFPVLTPLSVDPTHRFPYISNLSLSLAVIVRDPRSGAHRFARVKVPPLLPRFLRLADGEGLVPVEQVIAAHLHVLFPGMEIASHYPFRVTRDASLDVEEEEAGDLLSAIESSLIRRLRLNEVVRLEIDRTMSSAVRELLTRELRLEPDQVYVIDGLLDLGGLWQLYELPRPELKAEPWSPVTQRRLAPRGGSPVDVFAAIAAGDLLVHHPYESFHTSVEAFLAQAVADPQVLAIKHTLYRTSGEGNPITRALIRAAEQGKEVVALIELKARFDEEANIEWARALETAGVHVVYGVLGLKTHAKIALVVRQEPEGIRRYCHVGTGNYNPQTAKIYEDLGLLTASPEIGADLSELFNFLTGYSREDSYRKILVAPMTLRREILRLIREEAETPDGRIVLKLNGLTDAGVIDALYAASAAGTEIDLIVRGICCLRPGIPGLSERIRVRSVLGRFLEHSRIFRFGSDARGPRYWIGSADLMERNLDRRVEVLAPVEEPELRARLEEVLQASLHDDATCWRLDAAGTWRLPKGAHGFHPQERLQELARVRES
jgi:polyphosphate kinase